MDWNKEKKIERKNSKCGTRVRAVLQKKLDWRREQKKIEVDGEENEERNRVWILNKEEKNRKEKIISNRIRR